MEDYSGVYNHNFKDETGKKYGKLTVLRRVPNDKRGQAQWECRCDCGKITYSRGAELRFGGKTSCGCSMLGHILKYRLEWGEGNFNSLYDDYRRAAPKRGHIFSLTHGEFRRVTKGDCTYCGMPPSQIKQHNGNYGPYVYNGLDRVDNGRGYEADNVVPCCGACNKAKHARTHADFLSWIDRLVAHRITPSRPVSIWASKRVFT